MRAFVVSLSLSASIVMLRSQAGRNIIIGDLVRDRVVFGGRIIGERILTVCR